MHGATKLKIWLKITAFLSFIMHAWSIAYSVVNYDSMVSRHWIVPPVPCRKAPTACRQGSTNGESHIRRPLKPRAKPKAAS